MRIENNRPPDYTYEGTEHYVQTVQDEEIAITNVLHKYRISLEHLQVWADAGQFPNAELRSTWIAWVWINDPARSKE